MSEVGESGRSSRPKRTSASSSGARPKPGASSLSTRSSGSSSRPSRSTAAAVEVARAPPHVGVTPSSATSAKRKRSKNVTATVYLGKLSAMSLGKYQKHYRLRGKSDAADLLKSVVRHFEAQSVEEAEVVQNFLFAIQKAGLQ